MSWLDDLKKNIAANNQALADAVKNGLQLKVSTLAGDVGASVKNSKLDLDAVLAAALTDPNSKVKVLRQTEMNVVTGETINYTCTDPAFASIMEAAGAAHSAAIDKAFEMRQQVAVFIGNILKVFGVSIAL